MSTLRFGPDREKNLFVKPLSERTPILPTFSNWESTDNIYYYNLLNKGSAKRKVTFRQSIITLSSNLLSKKLLRYQIRYQTRSNNSSEKSPDDDDDDPDDDDNNNNQGNNLQTVNLINPSITFKSKYE